MNKLVLVSITLLLLSGCGSTKKNSGLRDVTVNLEKQVASLQAQNDELFAENRQLKLEVDKLNRVVSVLDNEKDSRVKESTHLRSQIRSFIQDEISGFKKFLMEGGLLDFIGGELVKRNNTDTTAKTLVDMENRIPSAGVLTGIGAYVVQPSSLKVQVMRYIESQLVVVWESEDISLSMVGPARYEFTNTVHVEQGDVIAYQFAQGVAVGFSEGTADTRFINKPMTLGSSMHVKNLLGTKDKRAYSIGVYGLLNQ